MIWSHWEKEWRKKTTHANAFDMAAHWEMSIFVCFENGCQKNAAENDTITTYQQIDFSSILVQLKDSMLVVNQFVVLKFNQMIETSFLVHFFLALLMHQDNHLIYFLSIGHTPKSSSKKAVPICLLIFLSRIDTYGVDLHTFRKYHRNFGRCSISIRGILNQFSSFGHQSRCAAHQQSKQNSKWGNEPVSICSMHLFLSEWMNMNRQNLRKSVKNCGKKCCLISKGVITNRRKRPYTVYLVRSQNRVDLLLTILFSSATLELCAAHLDWCMTCSHTHTHTHQRNVWVLFSHSQWQSKVLSTVFVLCKAVWLFAWIWHRNVSYKIVHCAERRVWSPVCALQLSRWQIYVQICSTYIYIYILAISPGSVLCFFKDGAHHRIACVCVFMTHVKWQSVTWACKQKRRQKNTMSLIM